MYQSRLITLLLLLVLAAPALARADFLPIEQAFVPEFIARSAEELVLRWKIAPGYYLYQSKFSFRTDTPGATLGEPRFPPAEIQHDRFFGEMAIHRDQLDIVLPLERADPGAQPLRLLTRFQGCADAGFCYPPEEVALTVDLPAVNSNPLATLLGRGAGNPAAENALLPAEEAFLFDVLVRDPDLLELRWTVAPGTLLYRDTIAFELDAPDGSVQLGAPRLPSAEIKPNTVGPDGNIGEVAVYHGAITAELPLLRIQPEATSIRLIARFQGCAERGVCYPPISQAFELALPPATALATPQALANAAPRVSEQDQIANRLAGVGIGGALLLFFGLGLLLAFTPCVFPMIPILSGIIAGQGRDLSTRQAFLLSLAYVLAMALTYAIVGVIAGLFGANLQAAFQNPWILGLFAGIFLALALSMFGFYDLQLPSALQTRLAEMSNRQQGGTLIGVALMGVFSALIVGPCLAPPLMGALIFIGKTGDAVLGFFALLGLGLGMGAPLLLIGTSAGHLLPRAGAWMNAIKAVFGVLLLAVALMLLERILPAPLVLLLWGLLLIGPAIYLGALEPLPENAGGWRKLCKALGVALLIQGTLMLVGAAAGGHDTLQPLRGLSNAAGAHQGTQQIAFRPVKTVADLQRELAAARGRPVMLDFYADWCVSCKELERDSFPAPEVQAALAEFVPLRANVTAQDAEDKALLQQRFGIPGPPALLFFDTGGQELEGYRLVGFVPAPQLAAHLRAILQRAPQANANTNPN